MGLTKRLARDLSPGLRRFSAVLRTDYVSCMTTLASVRLFDVVLWLHVTCVVIAFGPLFAFPVIAPMTVRRSPQHVAWLHQVQSAIGRYLVTPVGGLVLLTGIYLAADADVFSKWWVSVPILSILIILGLGGAYFAPRDRKLAELSERDIAASGAGEVAFSPEYQALSRQVATVGVLVIVLVVITIFIMVVGPLL
jgi:small-conductance mechanosensitive channel